MNRERERERERERKREKKYIKHVRRVCLWKIVCACVYACLRVRKRERGGERERESVRNTRGHISYIESIFRLS
jgi:hypothetical protein